MHSYLRIRHKGGLTVVLLIIAFIFIFSWVLKLSQFCNSSAQPLFVVFVVFVLEFSQLFKLTAAFGDSVERRQRRILAFVKNL